MDATDTLIARLAAEARPVRRLRPPLVRALAWLGVAVLVIGCVVAISGLRPDIALKLGETKYVLEWIGSVATGIAAAIATFQISLPDRSRRWLLLPLPTLALWLSAVGYGCLTDWLRFGPNGPALGTSFHCFQSIVMMSVPIGIVLLLMVRYAGRVRPTETATMAGLATASLAAAGLSLFHPLDATIMVLIWHGLGIAFVVLAANLLGRPLFRLIEPKLA